MAQPRRTGDDRPGSVAPHPSLPVLPGVEKPRRFRARFHYELIACGLAGHELVGMDAATVRPSDAVVVREGAGVRWYRCLRCDSWIPLEPPSAPAREYPPDPGQIELPLRGRPLRDKFVLRLIAIDRAFHFVVLGLLSLAVVEVAAHRTTLRSLYEAVLSVLQGSLGGPTGSGPDQGLFGELNKVFSYSNSRLYLTAGVLGAYALVEAAEMVGLWLLQRWAEYLTLIVTSSLLPLEIYEIAQSVSIVKVVAFVVNIAVVAYLLWAKRLFGVRGGARAEREARAEDLGWDALVRATPPVDDEAAPARVTRGQLS
ncbi:MAG TPA: DUF2127 domain-containing protein [Actinomycetota bacterium]|jgi:uncharacterized membrane protein (DUF2068 family)